MGMLDPEENGWVRGEELVTLKEKTKIALLKRLRQLRDGIETAPELGLSQADLVNVVQDMVDEVKATGGLFEHSDPIAVTALRLRDDPSFINPKRPATP